MNNGQAFVDIGMAIEVDQGEAWMRTAIGSVSYGVYLQYRGYCESHLGFDRRKMAREHRAVNSLIGSVDGALALELNRLRVLRNQADYDLGIASDEVEGMFVAARDLANTLLDAMATLPTSPSTPTGS